MMRAGFLTSLPPSFSIQKLNVTTQHFCFASLQSCLHLVSIIYEQISPLSWSITPTDFFFDGRSHVTVIFNSLAWIEWLIIKLQVGSGSATHEMVALFLTFFEWFYLRTSFSCWRMISIFRTWIQSNPLPTFSNWFQSHRFTDSIQRGFFFELQAEDVWNNVFIKSITRWLMVIHVQHKKFWNLFISVRLTWAFKRS